MQRTLHYNFPLFEGEDIPSIIESWNPTMAAIDAKLYALSVGNAGPEIIHELEQLIATVNDLIATVNEVISNVDNIQDTVNGIQRNMSTIYETLRTLQTEIENVIAEMPDVSQIESDIDSLQSSVGTLTTTVETLNTRVTSMQTDVGKLKSNKMDVVTRNSFPSQPVDEGSGVKIYLPYFEKQDGPPVVPTELVAWSKGSAFYFADYDDVSIVVTLPNETEVVVGTLESYNNYRGNTYAIRTYESGGETISYWVIDYRKVTSTLPIATPITLGGIKVGTGLSIDENGVLSSQGGQSLTDAQIGCKSLIYQIRKNMEVDGLRQDYNINALYSYAGRAHFGLAPENVSADRRGLFALDVELSRLDVYPTSINAQLSVEPNVDLGAYISYNLRSMKRSATLIDGIFHTDASDNTPTMLSGMGTYEEDWQTPGTYVFRPEFYYMINWYDLVQSGDLTNDQFQLLQNAIYQDTKSYQQELFTFGFGNTNNPASPLVKLSIMADVNISRAGISINFSLKYSSYDLTHSPSVFPTGYTKPSDYVKTPVFNDVSSIERQTTVALGALDGASALLNAYASIAMVGTPSSFSASNVVLDQAWFNLILAEGIAISD